MRKQLLSLAAATLLLTSCSATKETMSGMDHSKAAHPSTASGTAAQMGGTYIDMPIAENAYNAELFDSTGKKFTLASLKGKYLVIANFLTSCQEICPMTSANIRDIGEAINKSGLSSKVESLVISVDGERDFPSRISAYKDMYGSKNWTVASGSKESLAAIWKFFGAPATKENFTAADLKKMPLDWQTGKPNSYDMVHADLVVIVDDKGHWRWLDLGAPKVSSVIPDKLKAFLSPQGISNLAKPEEPSWSVTAVTSALSDLVGKKI
jgi:protein SCO1/2